MAAIFNADQLQFKEQLRKGLRRYYSPDSTNLRKSGRLTINLIQHQVFENIHNKK